MVSSDRRRCPLPPKLQGPPPHLNCVKKVVLLACVALLFVALRNLDISRLPGARNATLPFKVALLAAREPDRELAIPVDGVRVKQVGDSWHAPRSGGRLHEGQDIFAKRGTVVRSATEGYVVRVGESPLGGKTVWVAGAGGRSYYYAHLDSFGPGLAAGDYVTAESALGFVGTTGNAAGGAPHLHFGVHTPGGVIDPLPLLSDRESPKRS